MTNLLEDYTVGASRPSYYRYGEPEWKTPCWADTLTRLINTGMGPLPMDLVEPVPCMNETEHPLGLCSRHLEELLP